ncbi:hypothetical protein [Frankia canadensis]|uniref:hypothetical protein n=1 Tax=Frankia canadensis TaxID=1836972 RepID=UPI00105683CA|nr:hypothetical protein [Frankia canadensis]
MNPNPAIHRRPSGDIDIAVLDGAPSASTDAAPGSTSTSTSTTAAAAGAVPAAAATPDIATGDIGV